MQLPVCYDKLYIFLFFLYGQILINYLTSLMFESFPLAVFENYLISLLGLSFYVILALNDGPGSLVEEVFAPFLDFYFHQIYVYFICFYIVVLMLAKILFFNVEFMDCFFTMLVAEGDRLG